MSEIASQLALVRQSLPAGVTLVAVFSDDRQQLLNTLNAITGFVVCALTIVIGIIMIVRGSAMLKGKGTEALHERTEE